MRSILIPIMLALSVTACSMDSSGLSVSNPFATSPSQKIVLDPVSGNSITLPRNPWNDDQTLEATQQVTAEWQPARTNNGAPNTDRTSATFLARISAHKGTVKIVVIDDLGRRALTIDWTPDALTIVKADWVPDALDPTRLLADMVMTYWPADVVRDAVSDGMVVEDTMGQRTLRTKKDGFVFAVIERPIRDPWQGLATVRNQKLGYGLTIKSQRLEN